MRTKPLLCSEPLPVMINNTREYNFFLVKFFHVVRCSYNLTYVTSNEICEAPLPTVEMALRSRIVKEEGEQQPFSEWNLIQFYTGERDYAFLHKINDCCCWLVAVGASAWWLGDCTSLQTLIRNQSRDTSVQYQLRITLSPATMCHCVNLTEISDSFSYILQAWAGGSFWCGMEQPVGPLLCAAENRARTFLSHVVTTMDGRVHNISPCSGVPFSTQSTKDIAVAYEGTFETCPLQTQCFPFIPLSRSDR